MKKNTKTLKETFNEALISYQKRDFETAETICNKILNIDPNHFDSIFMIASISGGNGNFKKAKELLLKAVEMQPKNTTAYNNLGSACKELGELEEAQAFYEKTLSINPNHTNANFNLGLLFYHQKKIEKAKALLEKTVEIQPNFALAHFNLGNLFAEMKEYKKAKNCYEETIKIKPDFTGAHNNLGLTYRSLNDYNNAINCYKETIKINPKHAGAYSNLGRAQTELGDFENAVKTLEKATKLEPRNLYNFYYLCELNKNLLNKELINKVKDIISNKSATKRNLAYGNFLIAINDRKEKNYEKELESLAKAHENFFQLRGNKFTLGLKYTFEDLLQISNQAHLDNKNKENNYKIKPIFIIGVPRCGSTLVEKILASGKKKVPIGEEVAVFENFVNKKILSRQSLNLGELDQVREDLVKAYNEKGLLQREDEFIFTDKSLNNFFYLNLIKEIFPGAKVINCRRNILSSIMSIFQNNLTELAWAHDLENIFKYCDNYFQIINKFKEKNSNFIYELEFEKFTDNPEIESKKLMKFCDLVWDEKCLSFYKRKDIISKTTSYKQIRKAVYKHPEKRYLPYKEFLKTYGKKYSWFD